MKNEQNKLTSIKRGWGLSRCTMLTLLKFLLFGMLFVWDDTNVQSCKQERLQQLSHKPGGKYWLFFQGDCLGWGNSSEE